MIITKISQQKNKKRYNLFVNNEFLIGIDEEILYKFDLKKGKEVNPSILNKIIIEERKKEVMDTCLNYLSYRDRTINEVKRFLERKEFEEVLIEYAINKCLEYGYLNDKKFAQTYMKDRINLKKHGTWRIKEDLRNKGISQDIIDEVVDIPEDKEYKMALNLAEKRVKSYKKDDYRSKYRKLSGYLQRRGYSFNTINKVLNEVLK